MWKKVWRLWFGQKLQHKYKIRKIRTIGNQFILQNIKTNELGVSKPTYKTTARENTNLCNWAFDLKLYYWYCDN